MAQRDVNDLLVDARASGFQGCLRHIRETPVSTLFLGLSAIKDRSDWTAMHWLCQNDNYCLVLDALLQIEPPPGVTKKAIWRPILSAMNDEGHTPLHLMAGHCRVLRVLERAIDLYPEALLMGDGTGSSLNPLALSTRFGWRHGNPQGTELIRRKTQEQISIPENQLTLKLACNRVKQEGMTEFVARTEINDLTPPQFVYMILDLFQNSMRHELAEFICSCVGAGFALSKKPASATSNGSRK